MERGRNTLPRAIPEGQKRIVPGGFPEKIIFFAKSACILSHHHVL